MKDISLEKYENEDGVRLSSIYTMIFKSAYPEAFSGEGHAHSWFNRFQQHEEQLKRFRLECDMGLVSINLRQPTAEEHWTVPVVEGFMEYLATRHIIRDEEYGIDIKNIVNCVGVRLVDYDQNFVKFLPKSIVTEDWLRYIVVAYANVVSHVDVSDEFLEELLEINPDVIRYVSEDKVTMERAVRSVCANSFTIDYIPMEIRGKCAVESLHRLQAENYSLREECKNALNDCA